MNSQMTHRIADLLTICNKARKTVKGFDSVCDSVKNGKAFCVLTASDASARTLKETAFVCGKCGVPVIDTGMLKEELAVLCGKNTAVIAVCDKGFADAFGRISKE